MNQPISDVEARIYERLEQARGDKGLKSIIAYRTGLDIDPGSRSPDQGMMALDKIRRVRGRGGDAVKNLRDHLFCRALAQSVQNKLLKGFQGMGQAAAAESQPEVIPLEVHDSRRQDHHALLADGGFGKFVDVHISL